MAKNTGKCLKIESTLSKDKIKKHYLLKKRIKKFSKKMKINFKIFSLLAKIKIMKVIISLKNI